MYLKIDYAALYAVIVIGLNGDIEQHHWQRRMKLRITTLIRFQEYTHAVHQLTGTLSYFVHIYRHTVASFKTPMPWILRPERFLTHCRQVNEGVVQSVINTIICEKNSQILI